MTAAPVGDSLVASLNHRSCGVKSSTFFCEQSSLFYLYFYFNLFCRMTAALVGDSLVTVPESAINQFEVVEGRAALSFVNNPLYSDKLITVGSRSFFCHTEYLAKRSEYFKGMFRVSMRESTQKEIKLHGLPDLEGHFEALLKYMYSGIIQDTLTHPESILVSLKSAAYLGINSLQKSLMRELESYICEKSKLVPNCNPETLDESLFDQLLAALKQKVKPKFIVDLILMWSGGNTGRTSKMLFSRHVQTDGISWPDITSQMVSLFPTGDIFNIATQHVAAVSQTKRCAYCKKDIPTVAFNTTSCVVFSHREGPRGSCYMCGQATNTPGCEATKIRKKHSEVAREGDRHAVRFDL
eukprot:Phypoly_transcript_09781.p1 GENE.Phypoly_transcript_09781~~Phypoly_transcript_09781.p1  ORF type:complete len:354 (+),score=34.73 Phypoly_transcript_09781:240-1301(+)